MNPPCNLRRDRERVQGRRQGLQSKGLNPAPTIKPARLWWRFASLKRSRAISKVNLRFGPCRFFVTINPPASSACNDSVEDWADARAPSCFKGPRPSRMARSRRRGWWSLDREQGNFPGCAARAASKERLERDPKGRWIIGSNSSLRSRGAATGQPRRSCRDHPAIAACGIGWRSAAANTLGRSQRLTLRVRAGSPSIIRSPALTASR